MKNRDQGGVKDDVESIQISNEPQRLSAKLALPGLKTRGMTITTAVTRSNVACIDRITQTPDKLTCAEIHVAIGYRSNVVTA